MDAKPDSVSKLQHVENEVAVVGHVLHDLPGALWSGVAVDFKANPEKRSVEALASAAFTAALYIGVRRAPIITRDVSALGGATSGALTAVPLWNQAEKVLSGTKTLLAEGWNASDSVTRDKLGQEYATAIGKNVAPVAEISLAAGIGVVSGHAILSKAGPNAWLSANLTEKAEYAWRSRAFGAENHLLSKFGSFASHEPFMNADGTANLLKVTESIDQGPRTAFNRALRFVDPHIEEARVVDLAANRVSAPLRGSIDSVEFGFNPKNITFHTHPDFVGARPSVSDVTRFDGVHMIKSGDDIALYMGVRGQYAGVAKDLPLDSIFAERGVPTLKALVVNPKEQTARVIEGIAQRNPLAAPGAPLADSWRWSESIPKYVDYKASTDILAQVHVNEPKFVAARIGKLAETAPAQAPSLEQMLSDLARLGGTGR
ncbi:MAG: hypothetical protein P4L53_25740 [Candidatus Obscuribacterales bacterium]|nr:hypothetical protein [Candidatus Obscuribacterales bacterium]